MESQLHSNSNLGNLSAERVGDRALEFTWTQGLTEGTTEHLLSVFSILRDRYNDVVEDIIPSYTKILVVFKTAEDLALHTEAVKTLVATCKTEAQNFKKRWYIPVLYHESLGLDLESFCQIKQMDKAELIHLHAGVDYTIHFFGFLPGFFYLGGLHPKLHEPRHAKPRGLVPKGSVAIGGQQTGVYPSESPGGWHIIGRTPISLFDITKPKPVFAEIGDRIQFQAITLEEYEHINKSLNSYSLKCEPL